MVLCRLLEVVVGSFVMASTYNRKGSLHGVTLPRSWILENVQKLYRVQNKSASPHAAWEMIKPLSDLLERVYSGTDNGESSIWKPILIVNPDQTPFSIRINPFAMSPSGSDI
jgi:hypothetical protein